MHIEGKPAQVKLRKAFKNEERAENWLDVLEPVTAIELMLQKHRQQCGLAPWLSPSQPPRRM